MVIGCLRLTDVTRYDVQYDSYGCHKKIWGWGSCKVGWLVDWSLTALLTQFRSYRAFKVELGSCMERTAKGNDFFLN